MAKAEMDASAEGDMPVRPPPKIEPFRMLVRGRIEIGGGQQGHDLVAALEPDAAKLDVLAHEARLGELHRRDEAQEFLDRDIGSSPILFQPVAQTRILQKLVDRARDEMRRGLVSREQEQEDHRHDLVATELLALLLDPAELGNQAFATART